jgi:peptide/nickel transport system permease protein
MTDTAPTDLVGRFTPADSRRDRPHLLRRLVRNRVSLLCLVYLAILVAVAVFAPIILGGVAHQNAGDLLAARQGPSADHLLGTDTLGRDVGQRLLVATRVTVVGVAEALAVMLLLGVPLGLMAGFLGGWVDRTVGWVADLTFSMPGLIIVLVVLAVFPQSLPVAMVTIGVIAAPGLMRVVRSATLAVREELYIAAARVAGLSRPYIMARHVLPRISGAVIVQASFLAGQALLAQTALAFLGLVVPAPAPSWGGMVADGVQQMQQQPWLIWPPGIAVAVTILAFGLLGDAVRDARAEAWSSSSPILRRPSSRRRRRLVFPTEMPDADALLSIEGLSVGFRSSTGPVTVVEDVSLAIDAGETVGLVGESGCGKTATAMAILGLLPGTGEIKAGRIMFNGSDLASLSDRALGRIRGREVALVSQEPMVSLNPTFRVGWQLMEVVRRHHQLPRRAARARVLELLERVRLPHPELVARSYPHELSGGMAQRVAIARALAGAPKLLIADEPTTALDVTVQAEILDLLQDLRAETGMAMLLVTHDWGVVADICDRAVVMYAGQTVEHAPILPIFHKPLHPYTEALLAADPHRAQQSGDLPMIRGAVPAPGAWPAGCRFHPRCRYATSSCATGDIVLEQPTSGRMTRCIHYDRLA